MWAWLQENYGPVSAIASVLTLGVWLLYFQILLTNYRRRLRAKILINRGGGQTLDARCVVTNMSVEAVYIEVILIAVEIGENRVVRSLSEKTSKIEGASDPRREYFQGPLGSGELVDIGSFRSLLKLGLEGYDDESGDGLADEVTTVGLTVVGTYTSDNRPVVAERIFDLDTRDGQRILKPRRISATQVRSIRKRRQIEQFVLSRYQDS